MPPTLTTCVDVPVGVGICDAVDDCDPERVGDADCVWLDVAAAEGVPLPVMLGEAVGDRVSDGLGVAATDPVPLAELLSVIVCEGERVGLPDPLNVLLGVEDTEVVCVWLPLAACVAEPLPVLESVACCVSDCVTLLVDVTVGEDV